MIMKRIMNKILAICFFGLLCAWNVGAQVGGEDIFINQPTDISGWTASGGNISLLQEDLLYQPFKVALPV